MMGMIKNLIRPLIPGSLLTKYRDVMLCNERIKVLEDQARNNWLLDRTEGNQKDLLRRNEFKIFSQTGEDGIIDHIFSKIGTKNKTFVEFGIQDGRECNTANLSLNFNWKGLLIEGDKKHATRAKSHYAGKPVKVVNAFITKDNINKIISENGITGEIDLLSIDIDGNDYWVWKEINAINPRVVVIEYNSSLGHRPIAVKYAPDFERFKAHKSGLYYGASLSALTKLGKSKGYSLVGCCSTGFNAFYVRKDAAKNKLAELSPEEAFYIERKDRSLDKQFEEIKHLKFEEA